MSINHTNAAVTRWAERQEVDSRDFNLHSQSKNLIKDIFFPQQIDKLTNGRQVIGSDTEELLGLFLKIRSDQRVEFSVFKY